MHPGCFPASILNDVVVGGAASILMIHSAACLKKSPELTLGNTIALGKKVTVSISRTDIVLGK